MKQPLLYILLRDIPDRADLRKLYGEGDQQFETIAAVLASDPRWDCASKLTFILRSHPSHVIGVMGYFDAEQRARIEGLQRLIKPTLDHLRHVDYQQAERDCEQLAARLIDRIGRQAIKRYHFAAIPRGGLIVLGMLAYALKLNPSQLEPAPDAPLIVVDDCSISGARFGQFLQTCPNQHIVFAPLYAHDSLLQAITAREPRVEMCVSAQALRDYAPAYHQEDYAAWRARWQARDGNRRYWIGIPEHVCFSWNEPDNGIWNPVTEAAEVGWRLVPDQFCLKNRAAHQQPTASIQHQPVAQGDLKPTNSVLFGTLDEQIVVANIETGVNLCLTGVAADMWRAIIAAPNFAGAVQALLRLYDTDEATLRADLADFTAAMQEQDILAK